MKLTYILSFALVSLLFAGCASSGTSASDSGVDSSEEMNSESPAPKTAKTAYEGSTGSGLLMERYKSGEIEGYQK